MAQILLELEDILATDTIQSFDFVHNAILLVQTPHLLSMIAVNPNKIPTNQRISMTDSITQKRASVRVVFILLIRY